MVAPRRPLRFIIAWFFAGIVLMPVTWASLILAAIVKGGLENTLLSPLSEYDYYSNVDIIRLAFLCLTMLMTGAYIGAVQQTIVKRMLCIELHRWRVMTVLGSLLGGVLIDQTIGTPGLIPGRFLCSVGLAAAE